jgi:hypothetical protein
MFLTASLSFMGVIGLTLLWVLDQFVYQRLLGAQFLVGLRMEQLNPALPPTRALMVRAFRGGASRAMLIFYLVPVALFTIVTVGAHFMGGKPAPSESQKWLAHAFLALELIALGGIWVGAKVVPARTEAAAIGADFKALFDDRDALGQLIRRNGSNLTIVTDTARVSRAGHSEVDETGIDEIKADIRAIDIELRRLSGLE